MNKEKVFKKINHFGLIMLVFSLLMAGYGYRPHSAQAYEPASAPPAPINADWLAQAQEYIRQSEYHLSWVDQPSIAGEPAGFQAPNRAQNLRFYFQPDGLKVIRRTETVPSWVWSLSLTSIAGDPEAMSARTQDLVVEDNQLTYQHKGVDLRYTNTEAGLEQSFIFYEKYIPTDSALLELDLLFSGDLNLVSWEHGDLEFQHDGTTALCYGDIQAVDARGRTLDVQVDISKDGSSANNRALRLVINQDTASYPLRITALISGTSTIPDWDKKGGHYNAYFGQAVATAGDVNGDGYSDVIVGAPWYDFGHPDNGYAAVFYGSTSGLATTPGWSFGPPESNANFGTSVATAGDVNGDGYSDVIIGAPVWDNGTSELDEGKAFVFHGGWTGLSTSISWSYEGNQQYALLGSSVACAGDINRDSFSDVIVGAPGYKTGDPQIKVGRAFVFHGSWLSGLPSTANWYHDGLWDDGGLGTSVATAGDVDGNGYADVLIGVPGWDDIGGGTTDNGLVQLFYGSSSGLSHLSMTTLTGYDAYENFGASVSTAGDVNGDGYSDIIVGAPFADVGTSTGSDEGEAYIFSGGLFGLNTTLDWYVQGDQVDGFLGFSVATAGDVNSDGYADVIIGQKGYDGLGSTQGRALIWLGSSNGLGPLFNTPAGADWNTVSGVDLAEYGYSVATAGDVNGDGYSDVIIGAPLYTGATTGEGIAYVFHGGPGNLNESVSWSFLGDYEDIELGSSVASAGDINTDGYADIIAGAPYYDSSANNEGAVFVWHGSANGPSTLPDWFGRSAQLDAWFGFSVDSASDVNGDGYSDIIVGAPLFNNGSFDEGMAFVWLGSSSGLGPDGSFANADWKAESNFGGHALGYSVAGAGDVNGDGFADVAVGAPYYTNGQTNEGRALVWRGSPSGLGPDGNYSNADWVYELNVADRYLGTSIAGAGDVNRDGYSDLVAGGQNVAAAWHGSASGLRISGESWNKYRFGEKFGASVNTAGDINGDGYSDVIVGAPEHTGPGGSNEGAAFAWCGSASGLPTASCWSSRGFIAVAQFGSSVANAGDINDDGLSEIVVCAPKFTSGQTEEGEVRLFYGAPSGMTTGVGGDWRLEADIVNANMGSAVSSAGDVNGDGYADLLVGAEGTINDRGEVHLFYGNAAKGKPVRPRQLISDASRNIAPLGSSNGREFIMDALAYNPAGRGYMLFYSEAKPLSTNFNGTSLTSADFWTDPVLGGVITGALVNFPPDGDVYHWRVRFKFDPVSTPFTPPHSRWYHIPWNGWNEADLRLPHDLLYLPFISK